MSLARARAKDLDARRAAQTIFDRPLVLEAGAGTGKTSTLVARLVVWCLGPGFELGEGDAARVLGRVLAITFTEAAVAEMESRFRGALLVCAEGGVPEGVEAELLPPTSERVARARLLLGGIEHLDLCTIHAFCRRLLARHPLEAGIHPGFEIDASDDRTAEIVRQVVEDALRSAVDPGFVPLSGAGVDPAGVEFALLQLALCALPAGALAANPFTPERIEAFRLARLRECRDVMDVIGDRFDEQSARRVASRVRDGVRGGAALFAEPIPDTNALVARLERFAELWPDNARSRLRDYARGSFQKGETSALGECREALRGPADALESGVRHASRLDPMRLELARGLLAPLLERVQDEQRRLGVMGFDGLLTRAEALLRRSPGVARLERGRIAQLVVDEFQDTDAAQCGILERLALDGDPKERPGLFLVGDPKQSIYGWRRADLAAYEGFVGRVTASGGELWPLTVNFRSAPPLLDEITRCVEPIMLAQRGVQPGFQKLVPCEAKAKARGEVEFWISNDVRDGALTRTLVGDANAREAAAVAKDLRRLHDEENVPFRDAALLFRQRADYDVYLEALRERGIPYQVEGDRGYWERREIIEAGALLRTIVDPHDDLALVAWLRSASVGVPDAAWLPLWRHGLPELARALPRGDSNALRAAVEAAARDIPRDAVGVEHVSGWPLLLLDALEQIGKLRTALARAPADVFVERLRDATAIEATEAARYLGAYRLANLERFFRDLRRELDDTAGDARLCLRRLRRRARALVDAEEAIPREATGDAVHVMTIHQAKGLDFEHVYLMQVHKGAPGSALEPRPAFEKLGAEYALFGTSTLGFDVVRARRDALEVAERVRTYYVALTRAKERLVVVGNWPDGTPDGPAAARTHADLVVLRAPQVPTLDRLVADSGERNGRRVLDVRGARFVLLDLETPTFAFQPMARRIDAGDDSERVAQELTRLGEARAAARGRMARPFHATASALASDERDAEPGDARPEPAELAREAAAAAGSLVHRALELLDPQREPAEERSRLDARLRSDASRLAPRLREPALERAGELLQRFLEGPLFERLRGLPADRIWRELPLLALPGSAADAPVGYVSGVIDLLYRDVEDRLVVADYKTDRRPDRSHAEQYARQGAVYTRAVQEALDLDERPRFELWWIEDGRVETLAAG